MKMLTYEKGPGEWGIRGYEITEVPRELYGAIAKLREYEKTGLQPEQIQEMSDLYLEKCEEVNRLRSDKNASNVESSC